MASTHFLGTGGFVHRAGSLRLDWVGITMVPAGSNRSEEGLHDCFRAASKSDPTEAGHRAVDDDDVTGGHPDSG